MTPRRPTVYRDAISHDISITEGMTLGKQFLVTIRVFTYSNKLKVPINGKSYFITSKKYSRVGRWSTSLLKKTTKFYSSIVTSYFYSVTGQVCEKIRLEC